MKYCLPLVLLSFLFLTACNENMPEIACLSCDNGNQVVNPEDRRVLIEEFTGVKCVNCPQASALIDELISIHGDKVVAVSMHTGFFARPYSDSKFDFRTDDGTQVLNFLKPPVGYPSAVFNRNQFDQEEDLQIEQIAKWSGLVQAELDKPSQFNMSMENQFDGTNRTLRSSVSLTPTEEFDEDLYITVMVSESGIQDRQLTPSGIQEDYTHRHVFRGMATNFSGELITQPIEKGTTINLNFTMVFDEGWNANNCEVIAFVHRNNGDDKLVMQATNAKIPE
ncbi:MAG: Omp28-related outer membrane protein [Bacteroidota bacterium]